MKKNIKVILSVVLAVSTCVISACSTANKTVKENNTDSSIELFSTYITEKVLQDIEADNDVKLPATFSILSAKGETENAQVVIRPEHDVDSCTISFGQLINENGDVFPQENVSLYYQKYIEVKTRSDGYYNTPLGFYPDMLLPYEKAVEYKENVIKGGENQAIVLSAKVEENQNAGKYTGVATIKCDNVVKQVEVSIDVRNIVLPSVKQLKTNYNTDYVLVLDGEFNDTIEMYEAYYEFMLDYDITARYFPGYGTITTFIEQLRKYYDNISSYEIPGEVNSTWNSQNYTNYALAIAQASLEDDVNYFDKARQFLYSVDEPVQNGTVDKCNQVINEFHNCMQDTAYQILQLTTPDSQNVTKSMLAESVRNQKALITNGYAEELQNVDIWCPTVSVSKYDDQMEYYTSRDDEHWIYTVNASYNPMPNHHIDDNNSLNSSRLLGWICKQNDISGRLYYETCYQQRVVWTPTFHYEKLDPYNDPMRYPGTNGDGYLLYPGAKYGIFGPIASVRLVAVRDSIEDYEILYQLEQKYLEAGYNSDDVLEVLYDSLFSNTDVFATGKELFVARERLMDLFELANNGVFVSKFERTDVGYNVQVAEQQSESTSIKFNESTVTKSTQTVGTDSVHTFEISLTNAKNVLEIENGDSELSFVFGKKSIALDYSTATYGVKDKKRRDGEDIVFEYEHTIIDGQEISSDKKVEKVVFDTKYLSANSEITIQPENFSEYCNVDTAELSITLYNPTSETVKVLIYVKGNAEIRANRYNLKPGKNVLVVNNLQSLNWKSIGTATGIVVSFVSDYVDTLYIGDIVTMGVAK